MNHEPSASFVLSSRGGDAPALLQRVDIDGRLDGIVFTSTIRQTWRHAGEQPIEAVYSFPLPPRALLLAFAAVRDGQRIEGTIAPRQEAEGVYEEALQRGDAPMLLEAGANGLHTASLGNVLPGENLQTEVRFVQLLRFEQGRLRLQVPTTLAPRYGQPGAAGLAPHQVPESSWDAEYPLSFALTIAGALAGARLECPTHRHQVARHPRHTHFELEPGARLDRDLVLLLHPAEPRPALLVTARDPLAEGHRHVALAAFELPRQPANRPVSLKLLVDCSGSMSGDSMASAQVALQAIADQLRPDDEVALMRFGDHPEVGLMPASCNADSLQALRTAIDATTASLGGTQMESAIHHALAMPHRAERADVLVITDGQVWTTGGIAETARNSGQRIFAIGVGSAPAEGLLRELTAASGGSCEFATPGEDLQAAALRMIERMRDRPWHDLGVDWGAQPRWQSPREMLAFGGDTIIAMAVFDGPLAPLQARLPMGASGEVLVPTASEAMEAEVLARLVADRRWPTQAPQEAAATSLRYRLLNQHTHCVLVHARADRDPLQGQVPTLVRVPQMLAAGWGGTGRVSPIEPLVMCDIAPSLRSSGRGFLAHPFLSVQPRPAFSAARLPKVDARDRLANHFPPGLWKDAFLRAEGEPLPEPVASLMKDLALLGIDEHDAWRIIAWMLVPAFPRWSLLPGCARLDPATKAKVEERVRQAISTAPVST